MIDPTLGWLTKICLYLPRQFSTQLFSSGVRGQASQGVLSFSAVKFSAGELILWVEGYPSPQHPPANPARPNLMHFVPTYSLCSRPKTERGEHEKPPSREECETLLEGKRGPSIAPFLSLPNLCVAHKGSRQAGRNQFHGATRWKWGRKRAEKDREAVWRFHHGEKQK